VTEPPAPVLTRYVLLEGDLILRAALPDTHPESWPVQYREATGQDIPDDWRDQLVIFSKTL
jgi:hypothetical protein